MNSSINFKNFVHSNCWKNTVIRKKNASSALVYAMQLMYMQAYILNLVQRKKYFQTMNQKYVFLSIIKSFSGVTFKMCSLIENRLYLMQGFEHTFHTDNRDLFIRCLKIMNIVINVVFKVYSHTKNYAADLFKKTWLFMCSFISVAATKVNNYRNKWNEMKINVIWILCLFKDVKFWCILEQISTWPYLKCLFLLVEQCVWKLILSVCVRVHR